MPVHVYRVIKSAQAMREDFLSDGARGKRVRDASTDALIRRQGFSAWLTEEHARAVATRFPSLGTHIAEVELPIGATLLPFRDTPSHQTAFGDPAAFVQAVVRIVPVE